MRICETKTNVLGLVFIFTALIPFLILFIKQDAICLFPRTSYYHYPSCSPKVDSSIPTIWNIFPPHPRLVLELICPQAQFQIGAYCITWKALSIWLSHDSTASGPNIPLKVGVDNFLNFSRTIIAIFSSFRIWFQEWLGWPITLAYPLAICRMASRDPPELVPSLAFPSSSIFNGAVVIL